MFPNLMLRNICPQRTISGRPCCSTMADGKRLLRTDSGMNGKNQLRNTWRNSSATRAKFTTRPRRLQAVKPILKKSCAGCTCARSKSGILHSNGSGQIRRRKKSVSNVTRVLRKFCKGDTAHRGRSMPPSPQWRGPLVLKPICLVCPIEGTFFQ
jgi:hypothetical protein